VTVPEVNPRIVGALIALYERAVGLYASLVNINAYHQPGVEAGKKAAASILDLQRNVLNVVRNAGNPLSVQDVATQAGAADRVESVYKILRHLAANQRGVQLNGDPAKPSSLTVTASQE
jgi:glucose-6-phosphate isomerase